MVAGDRQDIEQAANSLKDNRFETVIVVENKEEAVKAILELIPVDATVGTGGSMTVNQTGIRDILTEKGNILPFIPGQPRPAQADVFLTSSNAITLDGKIINTDRTGNRVSQMIYGPSKAILVIGQNKIVADVDEALDRVQNIISPVHGKTMGIDAPCAKDGQCHDCKSPGRICNITTIMRKKPSMTDVCIILVAEDLGLGWDPGWPQERIDTIFKNYAYQWKLERSRFRPPAK